ncbi:unnamed protein product [Lampetra planeri]
MAGSPPEASGDQLAPRPGGEPRGCEVAGLRRKRHATRADREISSSSTRAGRALLFVFFANHECIVINRGRGQRGQAASACIISPVYSS